ncbi:hypothetical protein BV898_04597 [Hypsibius exemplaris]|uniref:Uncharacterized protein n=1 Tax=Hypsibius exemplaris TaxID=2072580 RepID=A0A1W0X1Q4_HYPEX|nr:hypothetical protein BV898_04597 [Hypsibius exemplaris]
MEGSHLQQQPHSQVEEPASTAGGLVSVDFLPNCTKPGGFIHWAQFEPFPVIFQRANQWLTKNPTLELRTCETVEFHTRSSGEVVNSVESVYRTSGEGANRYVRGLRLWMQPRIDGGSVVQQIGYFNVMPTVRVGFFTTDVSHRLDSLIHETNALFTSNPLPGKLLTIETVTLKVSSSGTDPDCTSWTERGGLSQVFAYMLRIFYIQGPPALEMIGVADFVPGVLFDGGLFHRPQLEPFPQVLGKAHHWLLQQQPGLRLLNAQTLLHKQKWTSHLDTLRMVYSENDLHTYYVRYIRLAYVIPNPAYGGRSEGAVRLNSKLFVPGMLEAPGCCSVGSYENQLQIRERMSAWMRATGAKVISVETVPMRIFSGAEAVEGFDTMHTWNQVVHHNTTGTNHHPVGHVGVGIHASNFGQFNFGSNHHHHASTFGQGSNFNHGHMDSNHREAKAAEVYLTLYRVYIDGVFAEPFGMPTLPSVEDYMADRANACTIL